MDVVLFSLTCWIFLLRSFFIDEIWSWSFTTKIISSLRSSFRTRLCDTNNALIERKCLRFFMVEFFLFFVVVVDFGTMLFQAVKRQKWTNFSVKKHFPQRGDRNCFSVAPQKRFIYSEIQCSTNTSLRIKSFIWFQLSLTQGAWVNT